MFDPIYTPRDSIDMLFALKDEPNKATCTVIPYLGYTISIAMDSSHSDGNLRRTDIRIYDGEEDITCHVMQHHGDVPGNAANLLLAFKAIDLLTRSRAQVTELNKDPSLKGVKGGNCNRTACQAPDATWYNTGSWAYYCRACANEINKWCPEDEPLCTKAE